jgi:hypothetical protein
MKYKYSLILVLLCLLFSSGAVLAKGLQATPTPTNTPVPQRGVCGTIGDQTWSSGVIYVVTCDVKVPSGVTLTIQPGAIVKFQYPYALVVEGQGTLRVLGTASRQVYLTSFNDDAVGGDTNGDGGATTPMAGDWKQIDFQAGSSPDSLIDYGVIRYGGCCSTDSGGITLEGASPTIQNTKLANNQHYAILADLTSSPKLTNNTYSDNDVNGLALRGGSIDAATTWDVTSTAYFITGEVKVASGATLTIQLGVAVKFSDYQALVVQIGGALQVAGTPGSQVYFTSAKDDAVKGDTNNDGGTTTAAPGDWAGIKFDAASNTSLIDYAVIRYGGCCAAYNGGINLLPGASPTIRNTILAYNQSAIQIDPSAHPTLVNITYSHNGINGLAIKGGTFSGAATWDIVSTAYVITDDVTVENGATLTINPGVVVKFNNDKALLVAGTLKAGIGGTVGNPVYFTSAKDDAVKGDTNNDGGATAPAPGNWSRIEFQGGSSGSVIDYAVIRYGSNKASYGAITLAGGSPTIRNSTITRNLYKGIYASSSAPVLGCNNIVSNNSYGLFAVGATVDVANQWWGSIYGPSTTGNKVGGAVTGVTSFKTYPCGSTLLPHPPLSQGVYDGWILESRAGSGKGGAVNATTTTFNLGDNKMQRQYLGILSFNTGAVLSPNAVITSVVLRVKKSAIVGGGDPLTKFQGFMVDVKNGFFGDKMALQIGDFQAAAGKSFGPFTPKLVSNWYTIELTGASAYINKLDTDGGLTQIRLRFKLGYTYNGLIDILRLYSGNASTAVNRPQLVISYYEVP